MGITRRFAILSICLAFTSAAWAQDFKVTLLGTGVPFPATDRFGAATLVEAGKERLLFDVGRGATIRLNQIGVPMGTLNAVFLTHFHSDHTSGIPDLWLTGWIGRYYGNRQSPFRVIGPKGTVSLMQNLERAYADDIRIRYADEKNPMEGVAIAASEYASDGVVYDQNGVTVTAFEVDHGALIKPATAIASTTRDARSSCPATRATARTSRSTRKARRSWCTRSPWPTRTAPLMSARASPSARGRACPSIAGRGRARDWAW